MVIAASPYHTTAECGSAPGRFNVDEQARPIRARFAQPVPGTYKAIEACMNDWTFLVVRAIRGSLCFSSLVANRCAVEKNAEMLRSQSCLESTPRSLRLCGKLLSVETFREVLDYDLNEGSIRTCT